MEKETIRFYFYSSNTKDLEDLRYLLEKRHFLLVALDQSNSNSKEKLLIVSKAMTDRELDNNYFLLEEIARKLKILFDGYERELRLMY